MRLPKALRTVLEVQSRFSELNGGQLAAAVTLAAFVSIVPLLIVGIAVLGFFSAASSHDLSRQVISNLGVTGSSDTAGLIREAMAKAQSSRQAASVVGLLGLLWTGLGVVGALQYVWNTAWQVPGRGWRDRAVGLGWLGGAAVLFAGSFVLSAGAAFLPWYLTPLGVALGFATGVGLWLWTAHILPNRKVGWRPLLPGALVGAAGFEVLKVLAGFVVPRTVASSSALYGSVGVVFAVLAWLLVFGRLVVYSAVVEVVLWERRHGTVELSIEAPSRPGVAPLGATRAGNVRLGLAKGSLLRPRTRRGRTEPAAAGAARPRPRAGRPT